MAAYINRKIEHSGADTTDVPLNRWGPDDYSFQVVSGSWTLTATLDQVNRGETPTFTAIGVIDSTGATVPATSLGAGIYKIDFFPAEVVRAVSGASGEARLMQQGATDWA